VLTFEVEEPIFEGLEEVAMINPGDSNFVSEFSMESGGNVVSDDAPFHVLVLGDWRGAAERSGGIESRKPFEIDRDEFDDVMRRLRPRAELFFGDANVLSIEFNEIDDFHPDRLFGRLSVFESLRQVREELRDPRSFDHAAREVRSWFSAEAEVAAAEPVEKKTIEEEDLLDAILSGKSVDAGDVKRRPKGPADLRDFISDIVAPHIVKTDLAEQAKLLAVVDEVTSDLMRQILHHPEFQKLESAWRGLHFLVRRTDTSSDLRIFLMDVTKSELEEDLKSASDLSQSVYCQWVAG
jgi:type VI secretion system protein ImpC